MINLNINHTKITATNLCTLVEGNVNSLIIRFIFSSEWNNLSHIAVFRNGSTKRSILLLSDECRIPWEVLTVPGDLYISLRGIGDEGNYVLCTNNEFLGRVEKSDANGELIDSEESSPTVLDSLIAKVAQLMENGGSGSSGKSAYALAVENGFAGTVSEWLDSLKGTDGHTPARGVDYFTDADISALVGAVLESLPNGDEVSY